ncbi:MAG: hypothetical protein K2Y21_08540 [Phycisphaerales bacterium]|nr:hypothetical protein [Phycisphaerales bacterium]
MRSNRHAFTLLDLVACIGLAAVVSAVGVPAVRTATSDNALQRCRYNLRFLGQSSAVYAEDFAGFMPALSFTANSLNPENTRPTFGNDLSAQQWQATMMLRRLGNLSPSAAPVPTNWIPGFWFTHVPLAAYIGEPLPSAVYACPLDARRMAYANGDFSQLPPAGGDGNDAWRFIFSSSYISSVYQWSPSRMQIAVIDGVSKNSLMVSANPADVSQVGVSPVPISLAIPASLGPRRTSDVAFPSQKVSRHDEYARHNGAARFFASLSATQDVQFYDGSVRTLTTGATNPGWNPDGSGNRSAMRNRFAFTKFADFWGGVDGGGASARYAAGWYAWTRGGLLGWDVPRLSSMVGRTPVPQVVENELDTSPATGTW